MRSLCLQELKLWRLEKGAKIVVFRYAEGCHHKRQLLCAMGPKVKGAVNTELSVWVDSVGFLYITAAT